MGWVIKVARPDKSVHSTDPKDFAFHSDYSTVKIVRQVNASVAVPASSSATVTIRHDLGFVPVVHLYTEPTPGNGRWRFGCPYYEGDYTMIDADPSYTYVDDIRFVFRVLNNTGTQRTVSYVCYIFGDPI